jgi:hypothetical protein
VRPDRVKVDHFVMRLGIIFPSMTGLVNCQLLAGSHNLKIIPLLLESITAEFFYVILFIIYNLC